MNHKSPKKYIILLITFFVILNFISSPSSHQIQQQSIQKQTESTVDILVYTATQEWPSKSWIYLLTLEGQPITYYEYEWYLFNDVEVVNNQVYAADWIAPCLYKINLTNGNLEQIISDLSLLYMYDVAFDDTYFYINEWNLNRYDINGNKDSTISFDQNVRGSAWDNIYYWTLLDSSVIKCWDISNWPTITQIPANTFSPPTTYCRGLWYDGTYFWTAEHIEGVTGNIYQFAHDGAIIQQIPEPIPQGYAACKVTITDEPPNTPTTPTGPSTGNPTIEYTFETTTSDPENHQIYYQWNWDDTTTSPWLGPYLPNTTIQTPHIWQNAGSYNITVKAKDIYGAESTWSPSFTITIQNQPPTPPQITGTTQGTPETSYEYIFTSQDPENDNLFYYIEWGDTTTEEWIGPYPSQEPINLNHSWTKNGHYSIKAKAKDTYNHESNWTILEIQMPHPFNKPTPLHYLYIRPHLNIFFNKIITLFT